MHFDKNGGGGGEGGGSAGVDDDDRGGDGSDDAPESERDYANNLIAIPGNNGTGVPSTATTTGSEPCFKCHLCDSSYLERQNALDHIRINHAECYEILVSQGAMDNDHEASAIKQDDVENRKVGILWFTFFRSSFM